ncbi:hypothetical protein NHX12_001075 [Muraenolepis orangiensis]|uniref:CCN family member 3 n=1 Tax=Muraenolepis orangiensis TaxID=630683 RepID=A0A9Q0IEL6_9TELE|nr:hypothetical protein NHX12_001075 [Muraenolepis orangiensis]
MRMSNRAEKTLFGLYITAQLLTIAWSQLCPLRCQCPKEPPVCAPAVPLLLDDCACCLVCARQNGELCSETHPCDTRRGLQCDYSAADVHKRTGVCTAQEGPVCVLDGGVYRSGQTFFPSCRYRCVCRDGQIGCVPRCNLDVMLPGPDCPAPRRVQVPGECCEKWVCEPAPRVEASALGGFAMAAFRQEETVGFDPSLNCIEQTTEWEACSKTCGMGVSTRVTNKNSQCEMVRQSRLCMVQPCEGQQDQSQLTPIAPKRGSKCQRMVKSSMAVHLTYRSCSSVQAYKPRYCGGCTDGRCCTPHATKTALVEFRCANGKVARRPVMVIQSCACHRHCPGKNAVRQASDLAYGGGSTRV